ncbi:MAG: hypothetical protein V4695_09065 [Pseudomonadota bacterium]
MKSLNATRPVSLGKLSREKLTASGTAPTGSTVSTPHSAGSNANRFNNGSMQEFFESDSLKKRQSAGMAARRDQAAFCHAPESAFAHTLTKRLQTVSDFNADKTSLIQYTDGLQLGFESMYLDTGVAPTSKFANDGPSPSLSKAERRYLAAVRQEAVQQAISHPLVKTSESRAIDAEIGRLSAQHPDARVAAKKFVDNIERLVKMVKPEMSRAEIFGSYTKVDGEKIQRHTNGGDILHADLDDAYESGNLRELITMAVSAMDWHLSPLLYEESRAAASDPARRQQLVDAGFDADRMIDRYRQLDAAGIGPNTPGQHVAFYFSPPPDSKVGQQGDMRIRNVENPVVAADTSRKQEHKQLDLTPSGRNATRYATHRRMNSPISPPLSDRERKLLAQQVDSEFQRLPIGNGANVWKINDNHPWVAEALGAKLHVTAGISGTAYRVVHASTYLCGTDAKDLQAMRLACLGHLVPDHHSVHEVMAAVEGFGIDYTPTLEFAKDFTQKLQTDLSKDANR